MIAQALPFETVPSEPLREHFTKWLIRSLTQTAWRLGLAEAKAQQAETARAGPEAKPGPKARPGLEAKSGPKSRKTSEPGGSLIRPRPQFVQRGDPTVWITKSFLRSRGWTDAAVRDFLPEPEGLKPNPRFAATGAPMPVWRPETVAAAEASPEWRAWLERSLRRRQTTLAALATSEDPDFRVRLEAAVKAIEACGGRSTPSCADRVPGAGREGREGGGVDGE